MNFKPVLPLIALICIDFVFQILFLSGKRKEVTVSKLLHFCAISVHNKKKEIICSPATFFVLKRRVDFLFFVETNSLNFIVAVILLQMDKMCFRDKRISVSCFFLRARDTKIRACERLHVLSREQALEAEVLSASAGAERYRCALF